MKHVFRNKKAASLLIIFIILFAYSAYVVIANTNQYSKILETETNFKLKIDDMNIENSPNNIVYFNTTMSAWNNGSTTLVIYQIQYSIYLNKVSARDWVDSEGGFLYQGIGNIRLEPGESITFEMEPLTHDLTEVGGDSPIIRNVNSENPKWNWIVTSCYVNVFFPEMKAEDREGYHTRLTYGSVFFVKEIEVRDDELT